MDHARRRGRGEGSVEELPSGKFRAVLSLGRKAGGSRHKMTYTADTKKATLAWLRERQAEQGRGTLADAGRLTLADWLDRWLALKRAKIEPGTYAKLERSARLYLKPHLGAVPLARLTALAVEEFYSLLAAKGITADPRRQAADALRQCLKAAVRHRLLPGNVALDVAKPRVRRKEIRPLTRGQALALLDACRGHRYGCLVRLALDSGMRQGELWGLSWPDVDTDAGTVFVRQTLARDDKGVTRKKEPKTPKSRRKIWLAPATVAALRAHRRESARRGLDVAAGPVFLNSRGRTPGRSTFLQQFRALLERAGCPRVRPYDLRHTSATLLLQAGAGLKMVSERLGHEDPALTLRVYIHALPSEHEAAAALTKKIFSPG